MKNKTLFYLLNTCLVAAVGLILGFTCGSYIFATSTGTGAYIACLLTLCLPAIMYALKGSMMVGSRVCFYLLIFCELVINIVFMAMPNVAVSIFGICQGSIVGLFLLFILIAVAYYRHSNNSKE